MFVGVVVEAQAGRRTRASTAFLAVARHSAQREGLINKKDSLIESLSAFIILHSSF